MQVYIKYIYIKYFKFKEVKNSKDSQY